MSIVGIGVSDGHYQFLFGDGVIEAVHPTNLKCCGCGSWKDPCECLTPEKREEFFKKRQERLTYWKAYWQKPENRVRLDFKHECFFSSLGA